MVGLSFCDFVGTRMEKALMALYRLKEWPRRFKVSFFRLNFSCCIKVNNPANKIFFFLISSALFYRMALIFGRWLFRSGRKDDALLSLVR